MIYINFVEFHSQMLHTKFQNHRPSGSEEEDFLKVFAIYSHGGYLGHVTMTMHGSRGGTRDPDPPPGI